MAKRTMTGIAWLALCAGLSACSGGMTDRGDAAVTSRVVGQTAQVPPALQDTNTRYWPLSRITEDFPGTAP
jgi:hypothetical protein